MKFIPLTESHPYFANALAEKVDLFIEPTSGAIRETFQPAIGEWPLFVVEVFTGQNGISISTARKRTENSWWENCTLLNPLPIEPARRLAEMIREVVS